MYLRQSKPAYTSQCLDKNLPWRLNARADFIFVAQKWNRGGVLQIHCGDSGLLFSLKRRRFGEASRIDGYIGPYFG
jgi:hypothetical protein